MLCITREPGHFGAGPVADTLSPRRHSPAISINYGRRPGRPTTLPECGAFRRAPKLPSARPFARRATAAARSGPINSLPSVAVRAKWANHAPARRSSHVKITRPERRFPPGRASPPALTYPLLLCPARTKTLTKTLATLLCDAEWRGMRASSGCDANAKNALLTGCERPRRRMSPQSDDASLKTRIEFAPFCLCPNEARST